ncbi:MAG: primosomal protein N' [Oscillospiraceae bacterium]|nr:primosomal protein N' [Oscillospiraceae bacterium]
MTVTLAAVAISGVPYAADRLYTYLVPAALVGQILPGIRVSVPFGQGNRSREGIVMELSQSEPERQLKAIEAVLDEEPVLSAEALRLAKWMRARYFCTYYDAFKTILPAAVWPGAERKVKDKTQRMVSLAVSAEDALAFVEPKRFSAPKRYAAVQLLCSEGVLSTTDLSYYTGVTAQTLKSLEKAGILAVSEQEVLRIGEHTAADVAAGPISLNDEQQAAYDGLSEMLLARKAGAALLYGVTASGKTQVYIKLIEKAIAKGRSALLLVPEIALTPQMLAKFTAYFGDRVAMLHSGLRLTERYDQWKRIRRGDVQVVLGTRSAVFAPLDNLGLIIMDEEQETTYLSENPPRYHTRDVAQFRCAQNDALLLMGSATPTVETMFFAKTGRYKVFSLYKRFNEKSLPRVTIADMRSELRAGNEGLISAPLHAELAQNIENGEQSILFLNRRGASRMLLCGECGAVPECPRCSVPLTYHSANGRLMCHYCNFSKPAAEECPDCGGQMKRVGAGTQKVEQELNELFPNVKVLRMDADTVAAANGHEQLLRRFQEEKIPILLGTQMVAKGLDFENVTLVGVLAADLSLYVDNYHAPERTFSLLAQVIGRAGRGDKQGRAVIQTFTPENDVIRAAAVQDYDAFYESEIRMRRVRRYPPFADLFSLTVSGVDEGRVVRSAQLLRDALLTAAKRDGVRELQLEVLGPAAASVVRVNNRYRYRIYICGKNCAELRALIAEYIRAFYKHRENRGLDIFADCNAI